MYEVFLIQQTFFKKIANILSPKRLCGLNLAKTTVLKDKITQNKAYFKRYFLSKFN